MTDYVVRPATESERRETLNVLRISLHGGRIPDDLWQPVEPKIRVGRMFGAFADGTPVGIAQSDAAELLVPGGNSFRWRWSTVSASARTTPGVDCSPG